MSSKITEITSLSHFTTLTTSNSYIIADFYADWCGPCKAIAPLFKQLAETEAKPGRIAFVKVNTDNQQDVARKFNITAMPTFLILKNSTVTQTIRGADPAALRSAITAASRAAAQGPAKPSAAFNSSSGRTLGGPGTSSSSGATTTGNMRMPNVNMGNVAIDAGAQLRVVLEAFVRGADSVGMGVPARFVGLYFTTLFSLDAEKAADQSCFVSENVRRGGAGGGGGVRVGGVGR